MFEGGQHARFVGIHEDVDQGQTRPCHPGQVGVEHGCRRRDRGRVVGFTVWARHRHHGRGDEPGGYDGGGRPSGPSGQRADPRDRLAEHHGPGERLDPGRFPRCIDLVASRGEVVEPGDDLELLGPGDLFGFEVQLGLHHGGFGGFGLGCRCDGLDLVDHGLGWRRCRQRRECRPHGVAERIEVAALGRSGPFRHLGFAVERWGPLVSVVGARDRRSRRPETRRAAQRCGGSGPGWRNRQVPQRQLRRGVGGCRIGRVDRFLGDEVEVGEGRRRSVEGSVDGRPPLVDPRRHQSMPAQSGPEHWRPTIALPAHPSLAGSCSDCDAPTAEGVGPQGSFSAGPR